MSAGNDTFEKNIERLQQIVEQLESGEMPLDKGVALYKEGQTLAGACRAQLDAARQAVSKVTTEGLAPFDAADNEEK